MVFKCQSDSFLKEYSSNVISCNPSQFTTTLDGKEDTINGYEVVLEDTILFPEGGGQPTDHGFLNRSKVYHVKRQGNTAVHYVEHPYVAGETVKQTVDWERRFDHMQQHSGQHLITAIIDQEFNIPTVSWWLGENISHVELDTRSFSSEQIKKSEDKINELIRLNKRVSVEVYKSAKELSDVRTRGLPEDHMGDVRVITIDGVDSNMCCGTHITQLSQLQIVKLLCAEKSKRKDKTLLYFLVGNRVLKRLSMCIDREEQLTVLLKSNPVDHPQLVEKLQKNCKTINKDLQTVLKDLAIFEALKLKKIDPPPKYYILYKKEADSNFINSFLREIGTTTNSFLFLSVGDEKAVGNVLLYGKENIITDLGIKIMELLDGKGAAKGNKFQAKVNCMKNRPKVEALLKEYFK